MHFGLCLCALVPRLVTRTRLIIVMHRFEYYKPTNTGLLASSCLVNSEVVIRGDVDRGNPPLELSAGSLPLVLFPGPGAEDLETIAPTLPPSRPVTLIVPDGSWRQAARMRRRVPGLNEHPCVSLGLGAPSTYRLRRERDPRHLSTIEAVARALGVLEGPEVQQAIERPFHAMVDRALWVRGALADEDVSGGIPEGALRHDPKSGTGSHE